MRRYIAQGLAIVGSIVSLGAAQGPNSSRIARDQTAPPKLARHSRLLLAKRIGVHPYQVGTASWYGSQFEGRETASGEAFNMYDLTAAHPTLPLGTRVKVTNLRNGRSVIVRINDRGPLVEGRIIDLSYSAAKALNMKARGVQRVRLDLVEPETIAELRPLAPLQ
ncbi:MAG TPA: septal ring lytic transglycosylase RlpA family protein [Terriglobales bacterium]|nr:septal ring lytic transglycosylase RlpA family protein [Terriglobales bacterium]